MLEKRNTCPNCPVPTLAATKSRRLPLLAQAADDVSPLCSITHSALWLAAGPDCFISTYSHVSG